MTCNALITSQLATPLHCLFRCPWILLHCLICKDENFMQIIQSLYACCWVRYILYMGLLLLCQDHLLKFHYWSVSMDLAVVIRTVEILPKICNARKITTLVCLWCIVGLSMMSHKVFLGILYHWQTHNTPHRHKRSNFTSRSNKPIYKIIDTAQI